MTRSTYSRSVAKYIRRQKAKIRKQTTNKEEINKRITELLVSVKGSKKNT